MLFRFRVSLLVVAFVFMSGGAVFAYQDSYGHKVNNGVGGGYVGSDSWFKSQSRSAAQRQMLQKSMQNKKKGTQSKTKPKAPKQTGTSKSVRQIQQ